MVVSFGFHKMAFGHGGSGPMTTDPETYLAASRVHRNSLDGEGFRQRSLRIDQRCANLLDLRTQFL